MISRDIAIEYSNKQERQLRKLADRFYSRVNAAMIQCVGRGYYKTNITQRIQLLTLRTWCLRMHVDVDTAVELLIPQWNKQKKSPVPIRQLTGERSEFQLHKRITERWPDGANHNAWLARKRALYQRGKTVAPIDSKSPISFVAEYRQHMQRSRNLVDKNMALYKQRRYPGNPWI